jgi:hypothetical protein
VDRLQREILKRGQVITYFKDIDQKDPAYPALQYFGTKGFFPDYFARSREPLDAETAATWWRLATGTKPPTSAARFTREVLRQWLPSAPEGPDVVTRGEFCLALYNSPRRPRR